MPMEVAVIFSQKGVAMYWHGPSSNTSTSIPDSKNLWDAIWDHRDAIGGIAHTHPWEGSTSPSYEDVTTFAAIEAGLGKRLVWPIVTMDCVHYFKHTQEHPLSYAESPVAFGYKSPWLKTILKLRQLSRDEF